MMLHPYDSALAKRLWVHVSLSWLILQCSSSEADKVDFQGTTINLRGIGATFPGSVYKEWMANFRVYRKEFVSLSLTYEPVGSGDGIQRLVYDQDPRVEYAGTTHLIPLEPMLENGTYLALPTLAGAISLSFNLPADVTKDYPLRLTRSAVVGIFNGSVSWWNDSQLVNCNPNVTLPQVPIITIARSDQAGTTEIFTGALGRFSWEWKRTYGTFSVGLGDASQPMKWNPEAIHAFANTDVGMAGVLLSSPYSIGYISSASAPVYRLQVAEVENRQGDFIHPDSASIGRAVRCTEGDKHPPLVPRRSWSPITDCDEEWAYPIVGYTYILISSRLLACEVAVEFYRYVTWFLSSEDARYSCIRGNMSPIGDDLAEAVVDFLDEDFYCDGGEDVLSLVLTQLGNERPRGDWEIWLTAIIATLTFLLFLTSTYAIHQRYKARRALSKAHWFIPVREILVQRENIDTEKPPRLARLSITSVSFTEIMDSAASSLRPAPVNRTTGKWLGRGIALLQTGFVHSRHIPRETKLKLIWMKDTISHRNVSVFYGLTQFKGAFYVVTDHCPRGSLYKVLHENRSSLETIIKYSLATDVVNGMEYLHKYNIVHGGLSSACCFLDTKWTVKVTDWEYSVVAGSLKKNSGKKVHVKRCAVDVLDESKLPGIRKPDLRFWKAPEYLQEDSRTPEKTGDIYSFGIILWEIMEQEHPFRERLEFKTAEQIVTSIIDDGIRPRISFLYNIELRELMRECWAQSAKDRPGFRRVHKILEKLHCTHTDIVDIMLERLERTTGKLKALIEKRDALMYQLVPPAIAASLLKNEQVLPEAYDSVTVYLSDIVGFSQISDSSTPTHLVIILNSLYLAFDKVIDKYDVYKIEVIGDAYMVVSGLPMRNGSRHVTNIANMALELASVTKELDVCCLRPNNLQIRIGFHSGPVITGVVGTKLPRYTLFGDTVNTALRLEATSAPMKIHISQQSRDLLEEFGEYRTQFRGELAISGKCCMSTYWLLGDRRASKPSLAELARNVTEEEFNLHPGPMAATMVNGIKT